LESRVEFILEGLARHLLFHRYLFCLIGTKAVKARSFGSSRYAPHRTPSRTAACGGPKATFDTLNETFRLSYLDDLIARKRSGVERSTLEVANIDFFSAEYARLRQELADAAEASALPETTNCKPALDGLLLRIRGV
jgi:hypothetical protein